MILITSRGFSTNYQITYFDKTILRLFWRIGRGDDSQFMNYTTVNIKQANDF